MESTNNSTTVPETLRLERETCTRCGGSGNYSYCSAYGTTCFKCAGAKKMYTKRGAAARAYLTKLRSRKARDLKVGDKILYNWCGKSQWLTIERIEAHDFAKHGGSINATTGEYCGPKDAVQIHTNKVTFSCTAPDTEYEVLLSRDEQMATLKQAIEYQNSLTKTGKPRKS